jgi:galactokinase
MRSHETRSVPLDLGGSGLAVLVADTRAPHRHSDGEYGARRRGCEEAARRLAVPALRDVSADDLDAALERLDDEELRRYVRHVVTEDDRVLSVVRMLDDGRLADIGPLLTASHRSMRDDFRITVPEVDTAVDALLEAGALGARMTGGGFGGCVIGLVPEGSVDAAGDAVRRAFADAGFGEPDLFTAEPSQGAHPVDG